MLRTRSGITRAPGDEEGRPSAGPGPRRSSARASAPPRRGVARLGARRLALALALALISGSCFDGTALRGEPCVDDSECGPQLRCGEGVCGGTTFACGEDLRIDLENLLPNVVLVLDRSGTMNDPYVAGVSRWEVQAMIVEAIAAQAAGTMNLGAILFPSSEALDGSQGYGLDGCPSSPEVDVGLCSADAAPEVDACPGDPAAVTAAIAADTPSGNSPTAEAIRRARAELDRLHPDLGRAIVLVTDDAPNCAVVDKPKTTDPRLVESLDPDIYAVVEEAAAAGIPTFVVGVGVLDTDNPITQGDGRIDGINPTVVLNQIAALGGRPRPGERAFYVPEELAELLADLAALPPATLDCTIRLDPAPDYPELVDVRVAGEGVERRQSATCEGDGYRYTSDDLDTIELCGGACASYRQSGALEVVSYCWRS